MKNLQNLTKSQINILTSIICCRAAQYYRVESTPMCVADGVYMALKPEMAAQIDALSGKTYDEDGGDASCKMMASWIKADRATR